MASNRRPLSKARRWTGDVFFVAGCVSFAMALVPQAPISAAISFGVGIALVAVSHIIFPFQDQLSRFRNASIKDPSHELKLSDREVPKRKDAI